MGNMNNKLDLTTQDTEGCDCTVGWDSKTVNDLAKLLLVGLGTCFRSAIEKISENGYSKKIAEQTVLKCGPFYGAKDLTSCIVDHALDCLKMQNFDAWYIFEDLNSTVAYMLLEMVSMLIEVKPTLSIGDAMWDLLICDLNLISASMVDIDSQKEGTSSEIITKTKTEATSPNIETIVSNLSKLLSNPRKGIEVKRCRCNKSHSGHIKDTLQQKPSHFGKLHKVIRMSKSSQKAKLGSLKDLLLDNKQSLFGLSTVNQLNPFLPLKETEEKPKVIPKPKTVSPEPTNTTDDYLAGIPYDESLGQHVPQDEKDEMILAAVGQLRSLQTKLNNWNDWANVKIMQVTKRLTQDRPELNKLKAEKDEAEKVKNDKEAMEAKQLADTADALNMANCQIKISKSAITRLKCENSILKRERKIAENRSLVEAKNLKVAQCKEQEALKNSESFGSEKNLLEKDLKSLKQEAGQQQRDLEKATRLLKETKTRLAKEQVKTAMLHEQAESIRTEIQRLQALSKEDEKRARKREEKESKKLKTKIKRIEHEIATLYLEAKAKKTAAIRTGMNRQPFEGTSWSQISRNNFTRRECVMCMSEEIVVVFVPCGHQVLCAECNVIHEETGVTECPSCRTTIQNRITACFAKSSRSNVA